MYRIETDLIGELQIPSDAYYGINTQRSVENFKITGKKICDYPEFIKALAHIKWAAAETNAKLGLLDKNLKEHIVFASKEIAQNGKYINQFPVDVIQGGAGTSTNMNINEVIANIALEKMGKKKGEYSNCSPNDHINLSQSTNDAYPSSIHLAILEMNKSLVESIKKLIEALKSKAKDFDGIIKMGRTQLQDAVPMTVGQEFTAFATTAGKGLAQLNADVQLFLEINMGGTAIGTGINADPDFPKTYAEILSEITGYKFYAAEDLIAATSDTSSFVTYSSALKKMATILSKISNDLRLLASGPRSGIEELNLPPRQAGSSIMPGKINPVIPEAMNQTCFDIIGNDMAITMASEAGQLQLNVMEPLIAYKLFESMEILRNATDCLRENCIVGITANADKCKELVLGSIGIVTALNPYIGYKNSTKIAKQALDTNGSVYDIILENKILTKEELDEILDPANMTKAHKITPKK